MSFDVAHGVYSTYSKGCRCVDCRGANAARQRAHRAKDPQRHRTYMNDWRYRLRREVIDHYGGACVCCGETTLDFLALDHKDGGGNKHRAEVGLRGAALWAWAKRNGYPDMFQAMCHNCNQAKGYYGSCPHERAQTE